MNGSAHLAAMESRLPDGVLRAGSPWSHHGESPVRLEAPAQHMDEDQPAATVAEHGAGSSRRRTRAVRMEEDTISIQTSWETWQTQQALWRNQVDARLGSIEERQSEVKIRLRRLETGVGRMETNYQGLSERIDARWVQPDEHWDIHSGVQRLLDASATSIIRSLRSIPMSTLSQTYPFFARNKFGGAASGMRLSYHFSAFSSPSDDLI